MSIKSLIHSIQMMPVDTIGTLGELEQTYTNMGEIIREWIVNVVEANDNYAEIFWNGKKGSEVKIVGGKTPIQTRQLETLNYSEKRGTGTVGQMGKARYSPLAKGTPEIKIVQGFQEWIIPHNLYPVISRLLQVNHLRTEVTFEAPEDFPIDELEKELIRVFSGRINNYSMILQLNSKVIQPVFPTYAPDSFRVFIEGIPVKIYVWNDPNLVDPTWKKRNLYGSSTLGGRASLQGITITLEPIGQTNNDPAFWFLDDFSGQLLYNKVDATKRSLTPQMSGVISKVVRNELEKHYKYSKSSPKSIIDIANALFTGIGFSGFPSMGKNSQKSGQKKKKGSAQTLPVHARNFKQVHRADKPFMYIDNLTRNTIALNIKLGSPPVYPELRQRFLAIKNNSKNAEPFWGMIQRIWYCQSHKRKVGNNLTPREEEWKEEDSLLETKLNRRLKVP